MFMEAAIGGDRVGMYETRLSRLSPSFVLMETNTAVIDGWQAWKLGVRGCCVYGNQHCGGNGNRAFAAAFV